LFYIQNYIPMAKKTTTLFGLLYSGVSSTVKLLKKPLIERALKRKFDSFIDWCHAKIDEQELELNALREHGITNPEALNLNAICHRREVIKQALLMIDVATEEKDNLFEQQIEVPETE